VTIYDLKPAFQSLLRPACRTLAARGVTANQVTVATLLLSLGAGQLLWLSGGARWALALIPAVLFARMALNAVDGMLAREHDMQTPLGAVLNELGDVASDAALYLPFAVVPGAPQALVVIVVVLAVISEMTGVLAITIGAGRRYDGPMGKSDRAFVLGFAAFLLAAGVEAGPWLSLVMAAVVPLLGVTIFNRARGALGEASA
jgi:CDP-diacylglycerol--glycerol-3-phosphate 3-phosphatidyltransferase